MSGSCRQPGSLPPALGYPPTARSLTRAPAYASMRPAAGTDAPGARRVTPVTRGGAGSCALRGRDHRSHGAAQIPKQRGEPLLDTAVRYAEERHWDVFPGTWLEAAEGAARAPAASPAPRPGRTPPAPTGRPRPRAARPRPAGCGRSSPDASILLPTGRTFDALDVPETAGFLALARMERMDLTLGPVTCTPDRRMLFFVLPGAAVKVADLVTEARLAARRARPGRAAARATYVAAPPTRFGAAARCSGPAGRPPPTAGCRTRRS